jgi:elongation factor P hydroxylase
MQYTQNSVYNPSLFLSGQDHDKQDFCADRLCEQFNLEFAHNLPRHSDSAGVDSMPTYLIGGASEPIYLPHSVNVHDYLMELDPIQRERSLSNTQNEGLGDKVSWLGKTPLNTLPDGNKIFFTRDYFASALHEVAHWCIAGEERRAKVDYDYWYAPDGRNAQQQACFEQAELKPQALEWAFSLACNKPFKVSNDNLALSNLDSSRFTQAVEAQLLSYLERGLPPRAGRFMQRLHAIFNTAPLHKGILL